MTVIRWQQRREVLLSKSTFHFSKACGWVVATECRLYRSEVNWKSLSCVWLLATPWTILSWNSPGQNTGVGSLSLLQRIYPTQGCNSGLLHCRLSLYQLSHKGSPRILEWVAYPFSMGSSWPRNRTGDCLHCRRILYQLSYQGSLINFCKSINCCINRHQLGLETKPFLSLCTVIKPVAA